MRRLLISRVWCAASMGLVALLGSSCVLGEDESRSPYENAFFGDADAIGVADGMTPVTIAVYGDANATLTLSVASAEFVIGTSEENRAEQTVQLSEIDESGGGMARVQLVATAPGFATLSFKLAPVAETARIEFAPVNFEVGEPVPVEFRPGAVAHELCVFANTREGVLEASSAAAMLSPGMRSLDEAEARQRCEDGFKGWAGVALFSWTSSEELGDIEVRHLGAGGEVTAALRSEVRGEVFPGYEAVLLDVEETEAWARIESRLWYRASARLPSVPAASVALEGLRSVPDGLTLVGSSSGSEAAIPETDSDGQVTLYFEGPGDGIQRSVFASPSGGGTLFLGEVPGSVSEP